MNKAAGSKMLLKELSCVHILCTKQNDLQSFLCKSLVLWWEQQSPHGCGENL
jgi:hypothetical protein